MSTHERWGFSTDEMEQSLEKGFISSASAIRIFKTKKKGGGWAGGTWLAEDVKHAIPDLGVVSWSCMLGIEIT